MDRISFEDLPEDVRETLETVHIPGQDPEECVRVLGEIAEAYPGFVPGRLNLAAMQLQAESIEDAEATYSNVLEDFPGEDGAIGGLATVLAAKKDFEKAEEYARRALENGYDWPPLHSVIGEARENAGDTEAAADAYLLSYRLSPHSWNDLANYCRLKNRSFISPLEEVPQFLPDDKLESLFEYIDETANTPDETGDVPGCDHTFRFTEQWAEANQVDVIELYQFLNSYGGFCDCEVCFNVANSLYDDYDEDEYINDEDFGQDD